MPDRIDVSEEQRIAELGSAQNKAALFQLRLPPTACPKSRSTHKACESKTLHTNEGEGYPRVKREPSGTQAF